MTQNRKTELMKYKAVIVALQKWLFEGYISDRDYTKLEERTAAKYHMDLCSILRETP